MEFLYISPEFPPNYANFILQLDKMNVNVWGIGEADFYFMPENMRSALKYYVRANLSSLVEVEKALEQLLSVKVSLGTPPQFDMVESHNEQWLHLEGFINKKYGIEGIKPQDLIRLKKKSAMKALFKKSGLPVARGELILDFKHGLQLANDLGYPLILKPDEGVGAGGIHKVIDEAQLRHLLSEISGEYLMEEFISGSIYSFDGLADRNGNLVFYTAHMFSQGIMETVNEGRHIYYFSLREIPPALEAFGRQCVKAFEVRERFFHIEFFQIAADRYIGLEVNMRPPGGFTTDMFNYACDIDIYRVWAELLVHQQTELPFTRRYHCCYASRKNNRRYLYDHDDIMARYGEFMIQVASVPGVFSSALGDIGYIFRSAELDDIFEITQFIHATES
ncbi:MAG: ATP-grasp domain-containing protein [Pseudomonadota bacterium]